MDFGFIKDAIKEKAADAVLDKINLPDVLKQAVKNTALKLSPADIKSILSNEQVMNSLMGAIKQIAAQKVAGKDIAGSAPNKNLMSVAGELLSNAQNGEELQKSDLAKELQSLIADKLSV